MAKRAKKKPITKRKILEYTGNLVKRLLAMEREVRVIRRSLRWYTWYLK